MDDATRNERVSALAPRVRMPSHMNGAIYIFHGIFWSAFLARAVRRRTVARDEASATSPVRSAPAGSTFAAVLALGAHTIGFGAMYAGIGAVVNGANVPLLFHLPWPIGALTILIGAAIIAWALYVFESWRCLAKLDTHHKLCTIGPYAHIRHPIYLACDLLAIGSFLWLPTITTGIAVIAMIVTGDARARREEVVLRWTFGEEYRRYESEVRRYVPGVY